MIQGFDYAGDDALNSAVATLDDGSSVRSIGVVRLSSPLAFSTEVDSSTVDGSTTKNSSSLNSVGDISLLTETGAQLAIGLIDGALSLVDSARADLGAVQNRLEYSIASLENTAANLSAARSRIRDTDYALEVSELVRRQILQQAATAMLAQANQRPQAILSLLQGL